MPALRILLLEDDAQDAALIQELLAAEGFVCAVTCVQTRAQFVASLETGEIDIILADYRLPSFDGLSALELTLGARPDLPFIFVSGTLGEEVAIEALKIGATDYVLKNRLSRLVPAVRRALSEAQERAERKRAENALRQFLAAASHDLRQPAQSLMLLIETLAVLLAGQPAAKVVAQMAIAADALKILLDGLLDIGRLDAGLVQPRFQVCDLGAMIERLADEYRPRAIQKGLGLHVVSTRTAIRTDPALLERILRNLIDNAVKYTETGEILLGCRHRAGRLRFEIHDTGVGIPANQVGRVFEEFHQINNPARDRAKGLGLGLAIVRRLCDLLGITIELDSCPGRGSCFTLTL